MTHSQVGRQSIGATSNAKISRKAPIILIQKDTKKNMSIWNERIEKVTRETEFLRRTI